MWVAVTGYRCSGDGKVRNKYRILVRKFRKATNCKTKKEMEHNITMVPRDAGCESGRCIQVPIGQQADLV